MNRAKIHFWQLTLLFLIPTILTLGSVWSRPQEQSSDMMTQMMGSSMGDMMKMMHASNITVNQLLHWQNQEGGMQKLEKPAYLVMVHRFTTDFVFLLTPVVLCGTVFLLIVWYC